MTADPLTRYIMDWRVRTAVNRLQEALPLEAQPSFLILCSAEALEGSVLMNLGFTNVTVSDISPVALDTAKNRDPRLRTLLLSADSIDLPDEAFDIVLVQDGLHHLQSPIQGFTEMMRVSRLAAVFLEPHDSLVGRLIGTKWERNGVAENYVFRWSRKLVEDVASSYLGHTGFQNLSFSFWHHNPKMAQFGKYLGGGKTALMLLRFLKLSIDSVGSGFGNQFCGIVIKGDRDRVAEE